MATATSTLRYILKFKINELAEDIEQSLPTLSILEGVYLVSSTNDKFFGENEAAYIKNSKNKKEFFTKDKTFPIDGNYYVILDQAHIDNLCSQSRENKIDENFKLDNIKSQSVDFLYHADDPSSVAVENTIIYTGVGSDYPLSIIGSFQVIQDDGKGNVQKFKVDGEKVIDPSKITVTGGNAKGGRTKRRKYRKKRKSKSSRKSRRKTAKK